MVLVPMFVQAVSHTFLPMGWRSWAVGAVSIVFVGYFCLSVQMALKIKRAVQRANEERYADSDDFPVDFANIIRWVPTLILILLAINFYADNMWVKFIRDIIFIGASVWFCILTLNPWRKVPTQPDLSEKKNTTAGPARIWHVGSRLYSMTTTSSSSRTSPATC